MNHLSNRQPLVRRAATMVAVCAAVVAFTGLTPAGAGVQSHRAACVIGLQPDAYQTPQDTSLVVPDIGVVANDSICGTDGLVISVAAPTHGVLTNFDDSSGGFTYTPNAGFFGVDTFTYTLEDVQGIAATTVTITIAPTTTSTSTSTTTTTAANAVGSTTTAVPTTTASTGTLIVTVPATPVPAAPAFTG